MAAKRRKRKSDDEEIDPVAVAIAAVIFAVYFVYTKYLLPLYEAFMSLSPVYIFLITLIVAVTVLVVINYIFKYRRMRAEKKKERRKQQIIARGVEFDNTIKFLENEIKLRYGKKKIEKDYQQDLEQAMKVLTDRHGYKIEYERSHSKKHRIDLVINDSIGVEMKVYKGGSQVKRALLSQISEYSQYCDKIIGFVVNVTEESNESIKSDIESQLKFQKVIDPNDYHIIVHGVI
ncbi:hypothetical protein MettiDRAFT_2363 [Methanolobus tindarius DSM 2278]|uniref:Uncharacterized protein n=1 Tax=Methanolobus tindarius DSM 2278 TaxID=1090322 RepID=W9DZS5_METTI|nr:GxxExxY protein [Methanolobus tindarius]ETA68876.1 hypothetical protein MettiDRAFT_2363 [Methanolobus tindarius DSM 2278]